MINKIKNKGSKDLLKAGLLIMFFSSVLLITKLNYGRSFVQDDSGLKEISGRKSEEENKEEPSSFWNTYANEKYRISFSHPQLLLKREYVEIDGYDLFIIFEENKFSKEKGIAFGVNKDGLEKEVERIKEGISKQGETKLLKDEKLDVDNGEAWILEFEPEDESLERKAFLVIEEGDFTYSFSTIPKQIQRLSKSIQFLD